MRDLHNIAVTQRQRSAGVQVPGMSEPQGRLKVRLGGEQGTPPSQIQPWYHIRDSHEAYGMTLAASTGYM